MRPSASTWPVGESTTGTRSPNSANPGSESTSRTIISMPTIPAKRRTSGSASSQRVQPVRVMNSRAGATVLTGSSSNYCGAMRGATTFVVIVLLLMILVAGTIKIISL